MSLKSRISEWRAAREKRETNRLWSRIDVLMEGNSRLFKQVMHLMGELEKANMQAIDLGKKLVDMEADRDKVGNKLSTLKSWMRDYKEGNAPAEVNEILADDYDYW